MSSGYDIDKLLIRSAELNGRLVGLFALSDRPLPDRELASKIMCGVAFEHAESMMFLVANAHFTSASSLLRLQYEVLVRAIWLLYAASDQWVHTLLRDATREGADKANKLPSLGEMLAALDGKAPAAALDPLLEFRESQWRPLCSFVHGGFHALHRHGGGFPPELVCQIVRSSNGLSVMAGMLLVILVGDASQQGRITGICDEFGDCLPLPERGPAGPAET